MVVSYQLLVASGVIPMAVWKLAELVRVGMSSVLTDEC